MENVNDLWALVNLYLATNFSVIPLKGGSKIPKCPWKEAQFIRPDKQKLLDTLEETDNIGIVTGTISNLIVVDADTEQAVDWMDRNCKEASAIVNTRRGKHYYFLLDSNTETLKSFSVKQGNMKFDVKGEGGYVVAPPSVVDSHIYRFEFMDFSKRISREELEKLLGKIRQKESSPEISTEDALVTEILPLYNKGNRQDICLFLSGWLKKSGFSQEKTEEIITRICLKSGDEDLKQRLSAVVNTYKDTTVKIKGLLGLKELGYDIQKLKQILNNRSKNKTFTPNTPNFVVEHGIVYETTETRNGTRKDMLGPAIKLEYKVVDDNHNTEYIVSYDNQTFPVKEVADLETIRKRTGIAIVRDKKFLEFVNLQALSCEKKSKKTRIGWENNKYFHPANTDDVIWDHLVTKKNAHLPQNPEVFLNDIKDMLTEGKLMGVLICASVSAILHPPVGTAPFVTLICGPSGAGKTTAAKICANIYYDSDKLELTMNATQAALERTMYQLSHTTVLIDEAALKAVDVEKVVFMTSSRSGKARSNKQLTVNVDELECNLIVTSEVDELFNLSRSGAVRRVLAVNVSGREQLSTMQLHEVKKNKVVAHLIADFIARNGIETEVEDLLDEGAFYNIEKSLWVTLRVLEKFYGEKFEKTEERIRQVLQQNKDAFYEREEKENVVLKLGEFILANASKFKAEKGDVWGRITKDHIYIIKNAFKVFIQNYNLHRLTALRELAERGILEKNGDEYAITAKIDGVVVKAFKVNKKLLVDLRDCVG